MGLEIEGKKMGDHSQTHTRLTTLVIKIKDHNLLDLIFIQVGTQTAS